MDLLEYETALWNQGFRYVCGIDECGRGSLVGDVVAAAVVLPPGLVIDGVNDSKQLTAKKREELYEVIIEKAIAVGVGRVSARAIEEINIKRAARVAMKMALGNLGFEPDWVLVDAETLDISIPQHAIIKGDCRSQSIAAASIVAKVTRDRMCQQWDLEFPGYDIGRNKGYATRNHIESIRTRGPSPLHRKTFLEKILFAPVQRKLF